MRLPSNLAWQWPSEPCQSITDSFGTLPLAREIISALIRDGFAFDRGGGSHQIYYHPDKRRVTVVFHGGKSTYKRKTLKSMIEQTHWTQEDLVRLGLVKK